MALLQLKLLLKYVPIIFLNNSVRLRLVLITLFSTILQLNKYIFYFLSTLATVTCQTDKTSNDQCRTFCRTNQSLITVLGLQRYFILALYLAATHSTKRLSCYLVAINTTRWRVLFSSFHLLPPGASVHIEYAGWKTTYERLCTGILVWLYCY